MHTVTGGSREGAPVDCVANQLPSVCKGVHCYKASCVGFEWPGVDQPCPIACPALSRVDQQPIHGRFACMCWPSDRHFRRWLGPSSSIAACCRHSVCHARPDRSYQLPMADWRIDRRLFNRICPPTLLTTMCVLHRPMLISGEKPGLNGLSPHTIPTFRILLCEAAGCVHHMLCPGSVICSRACGVWLLFPCTCLSSFPHILVCVPPWALGLINPTVFWGKSAMDTFSPCSVRCIGRARMAFA